MIEGEDDGEDIDVFEQSGAAPSPDPSQRWVQLPPAGMLSLEEADALLRWRGASVIAIVGEHKSGKTTLITELYARFLKGPFADCDYSHSLSLLGFEMKSFKSRAISGGRKPDTPRTSKQDGLSFFHLAVNDGASASRSDLLISERAGEAYREVRDKPAGSIELVEVRKAHTIAFVLDGERLADGRRRAEAIASVRDIARAFANSGALLPAMRLQLVTTKCDLLDDSSSAPALEALSKLEERFMSTYGSHYSEVRTFRTAARDPEGKLEAGHGLAPLLRSWIAPAPAADIGVARQPELNDEYDKLLVRRLVR